ncbi:MAG TPA: hypothetical protein VHG91_08290 [Longimicrobium sp.]|nr:hypothetical protein [Longimicrobium sp.]
MSGGRMDAWSRWEETWALAGLPARREPFERLCARYGEAHRGYHDLEHVAACLALAAESRALLRSPAEVELALWYHDAVYDPKRGDNEERSADLARDELRAQGLAESSIDTVHAHILATKHPSRPDDPDARLLVDIDLSILAADPERFDAYEAGVRKEYAWVPGFLFRRNRAAFLRELLASDRLFLTDLFHERFERRARENVARSLAR